MDGLFFISVSDFRLIFSHFTITYYHDNWQKSFYELNNASAKKQSYFFTVPRKQEVFISGNVYMKRQFPCSGINNKYDLELYKNGMIIDKIQFAHPVGFGHLRQIDLAPGKYEVKAGMAGGYFATNEDYPYDFTLTVYAEDYMPITDASGNKKEDTSITYYDSGETVEPEP